MSSALGGMNLVEINENMKQFEQLFDNLDVTTDMMDKVMDNVNAGAYNEKDVNNLINQVAVENNLKIEDEFGSVSSKNKFKLDKNIQNKENVSVMNQNQIGLK